MLSGNIDGLINGTWKVRKTREVIGSSVSSISFDVSDRVSTKYTLISFVKSTGISVLGIRFNSDTGSVYGQQIISGQNTTATSARYTGQTYAEHGQISSGTYNLAISDISKVDSSLPCLINTVYCSNMSSSSADEIRKAGSVWNNTLNNIESIDVLSLSGTYIDVGSFFVLLEEVEVDGIQSGVLEPNKYVGGIELVDEYEVEGSAETSFSFSGLKGNTDKIYLYRWLVNMYSSTNIGIRFNNSLATDYDYPYQMLDAQGSTVTSTRSVGNRLFMNPNTQQAGTTQLVNGIIFALSGNIRICLCEYVLNAASSGIDGIALIGQVWNNTTDEIDTITFLGTSGTPLGDGTKAELYKINDL